MTIIAIVISATESTSDFIVSIFTLCTNVTHVPLIIRVSFIRVVMFTTKVLFVARLLLLLWLRWLARLEFHACYGYAHAPEVFRSADTWSVFGNSSRTNKKWSHVHKNIWLELPYYSPPEMADAAWGTSMAT
jgi:hypothetical protein